jgi:hypothetical protein
MVPEIRWSEFTVTWEDDTSVTIPIVYGKDVMDWWYDDASSEPSRGKVAWKAVEVALPVTLNRLR